MRLFQFAYYSPENPFHRNVKANTKKVTKSTEIR